MELIRKLHDSLIPKSKLIIFCDGKILYDHTQNDYFFEINDLNPLDNYSPYLSIANDNSLYIYVLVRSLNAHQIELMNVSSMI